MLYRYLLNDTTALSRPHRLANAPCAIVAIATTESTGANCPHRLLFLIISGCKKASSCPTVCYVSKPLRTGRIVAPKRAQERMQGSNQDHEYLFHIADKGEASNFGCSVFRDDCNVDGWLCPDPTAQNRSFWQFYFSTGQCLNRIPPSRCHPFEFHQLG